MSAEGITWLGSGNDVVRGDSKKFQDEEKLRPWQGVVVD